MRVYLISVNWGHGGPGGIASDLYYTLVESGHKCRFAYARESVPKDINSYRIGTMIDVYAHVAVSRIFDNAGFLSSRATKGLIRDIKKYKPDVISIQNPLGYSMNVSLLLDFIRKSKIPAFWTLHDCWSFTGHCTTELCERIKHGCGNCPHKSDFPKSILFDNSRKNLIRKKKEFSGVSSLSFVAPSEWIKNLAEQSYLCQYPIKVINNGIDLSVFKPIHSDLRKKHSLQKKRILLCVASVWSSRKGSKYIYKINEILDSSYAIVMIGKNDDEKLKYMKRIIHIPQTENREELAKWYTVADVFINPTIGDNFPTVNLEALACGTPVVTFDTGGSKESVGDCGKVVTQGSITCLISAIEECISDGIPSSKCRNRALNYEKTNKYNEYISLFQSKL